MKTISKYIFGGVLLSALALTGCKDKMRELNTNQTSLQSTDPRYMFFAATRLFDNSDGRGFCATRSMNIGRWMQYFATTGSSYPAATDLSISSPWPGAYWSEFNVRNGSQLHALCEYVVGPTLSELEKMQYQEIGAIAKVLETYLAWRNFDVYGAAVYTQAFRAAEGIKRPEYDLVQNVYKTLDQVVKKKVVDVLKQPAPAGTLSLGKYDPMYGFTVKVNPEGGSTVTPLENAEVQRSRWLKFANTFRLKMAYRFKERDAAHFNTVLAEVLDPANGGMISSNDESCILKFPKDVWGDDTNDGNQVSYYNRAPLSMINSLKVMKDPRLPLLFRPNFNDTSFVNASYFKNNAYAKAYKWMYTHFPDSLTKYGNLMQLHNVYQGVSQNSYAYQQTWVPGVIMRGQGFSFGKIVNSNFNEDPKLNKPLLSPKTGEPIVWGKDTTITFYICSMPQGRYWVKNGGDGYDWYDQPKPDKTLIQLTRPVIAYDEHCFTMALIAQETGAAVGGKTAEGWYEEAVRANMAQLMDDALRVYVGIATSVEYPLLPPYNGTSAADKHLYKLTPAMIDDYVASILPLGKTGNAVSEIMTQTWFAMIFNPEEMWGMWKLTGYPQFIKIPVKNGTGAPGTNYLLPDVPGLEMGFTSGNEATALARRAAVPQPEVENNANYMKIQQELMATPGFGTSWNDNTGRIWWDTKPMAAPIENPTLYAPEYNSGVN